MSKNPPRGTEGSVGLVIGRDVLLDTQPQFRVQSNDCRVIVLGSGTTLPSVKGLIEHCRQQEIAVDSESHMPQKNNWFRQLEHKRNRNRFNR